jgi:MSHA pilin protein MshA
MTLTKQQGFTLIELVMVIVILGILAATALPKFVDMSKSARISTLNGLQGALQGAKSLVKAGYMINPAATVTLSDGTTTVAVVTTSGATLGLPTATAAGIGNAVEFSSSDYTPSYAISPNVATFTLASKADCSVTYTESSGAVAVNPGGC